MVLNATGPINSALSQQLASVLPSNPITNIFIQHPLAFLAVFFVVALGIMMAMRLMSHLWMLPFAIGADLLDVLSNTYPVKFDFLAAIASFALFAFFLRDSRLKKAFILIASIEAVIGTYMTLLGNWGAITNIFPMNTVLMLIFAVIRK